MGQSRHFDRTPLTSGLPRLADILRVSRHVSKVPIPEVAPPPFDQRAGVRPGLGVKLGSGRQGQVEFAMRRLVKAQPENTQDFTGRFESKKWEPQPNQFYLILIVILSETSGGLNG